MKGASAPERASHRKATTKDGRLASAVKDGSANGVADGDEQAPRGRKYTLDPSRAGAFNQHGAGLAPSPWPQAPNMDNSSGELKLEFMTEGDQYERLLSGPVRLGAAEYRKIRRRPSLPAVRSPLLTECEIENEDRRSLRCPETEKGSESLAELAEG